MMNPPLVSVIIPTYNRAGIIRDAIDSVLNQTYRKVEVIVVDDGSTDDTKDVLARYGNRIRIITQQNAGPTAARNRGIQAATGEIIAFQDSDDLWNPTKLERQVHLMESAHRSVVCCVSNMRMIYSDGRENTSFGVSWLFPSIQEGIWLNAAEVLATRFLLFTQGAMVRREVLQKVQGFNEALAFYLEDRDLSLRLALEGPWAFIRDPLVTYRASTPGSLSKLAWTDAVCTRQSEVRICEDILTRVKDNPELSVFCKHLRRRLKFSRFDLLTAKLAAGNTLSRRLASVILGEVVRYAFGIRRRSPWFPKMRVVDVTHFVPQILI